MTLARIKKDDRVIVLAGKDKGKVGQVIRVLTAEQRVVVAGVNMVAKHQRPTQQSPNGGIVRKEAPIHLSNVAPVDPKTGKATRVRSKVLEGKSGKSQKVRVAVKSGEQLD